MPLIKKLDDINWLENFSRNNTEDISFNLYNSLMNSEEELKTFWDMFSDFYYISCSPFKDSTDKRKDIPEIHEILERYNHTAEWRHLEILIGKYSEETMEKALKKAEERKKEFWSEFVNDPKPYIFMFDSIEDLREERTNI